MKVLLTGYAGLLGRHIARALKREGHTIRVVLHQRTVTRKDFGEEADELIWGSLEDPLVMKKALAGVDAVVHSAWKFSAQNTQRPTPNELVTESLYKESVRAGVHRFAFISSVAVYGMKSSGPAPVTESSPVVSDRDGFIYPAEKVMTERMLATMNRGTMSLGIFRPGPIFDDVKSPIKKIIGKRALGFGTGRNPMPYIHAADVGDAVARWLAAGTDGAIYNITPTTSLRHRDWFVAWGRYNGIQLKPVFLRSWVMQSAAMVGTLVKRMLKKSGKVDVSYALAAATRGLRYDNAKAITELGWKPVQTDKYSA